MTVALLLHVYKSFAARWTAFGSLWLTQMCSVRTSLGDSLCFHVFYSPRSALPPLRLPQRPPICLPVALRRSSHGRRPVPVFYLDWVPTSACERRLRVRHSPVPIPSPATYHGHLLGGIARLAPLLLGGSKQQQRLHRWRPDRLQLRARRYQPRQYCSWAVAALSSV